MSADIDLDRRLILLRKKMKACSRLVTNEITKNRKPKICVFCGVATNLTREHVVPKWAYDGRPDKHFTTTTNGIGQKYNAATVPACSECNSYILGCLEKHVQTRLLEVNLKNEHWSKDDEDKLILWLELIDYKFQTFNLRRRFLKPAHGPYVPFLADLPLGIMENNASFTPSQVHSRLRQAFKRVIRKSKQKRRVTLVTFKTTNPDFHFFHQTNDFIFVEIPKLGVALFYFFVREFDGPRAAYDESRKIIKNVYSRRSAVQSRS